MQWFHSWWQRSLPLLVLSFSLSRTLLYSRYQQTIIVLASSGPWRFPPWNKPSHAAGGIRRTQEERKKKAGSGFATDRGRKGGSFLTLRGMLSGSRCRNKHADLIGLGCSWSRTRLHSPQVELPARSARVPPWLHHDPSIPNSHGRWVFLGIIDL